MAEKEYIERDKALEECDWYANEFCECEYAIMSLKGALENLPAADVRPVRVGKLMGVYINMEMPENCALCPVWDAGNCLVATEAIICEYTKRPSDCPLVPVPTHGDLIDRDALITTFCEWGTCLERGRKLVITMCEAKQAIVDIIEDAPTIIPAEEGE